MADLQALGTEALNKQPVYYMDATMSWEQRLAAAYDEATAHIKATLPPGVTIDTSKYEQANDLAGNHINAYGDDWLSTFRANKDLSVDSAVRFNGEQGEQYYLGRYAQASANLGAYLTGYARQQIPLGALTQEDFDQGAELRLRALSEVIHLGRTGALPAVIAADKYALANNAPKGGSILVATPGVTINPATGTSGLGCELLCLTITIGVLAILAATAITVSVMWVNASQKDRQAMLETCNDAVRLNNAQAPAICANMSKVVAEMAAPGQMPSALSALIPADLQKQIITYGAIGLGAYLLLTFAPQIASSLSKTKDVLAARQVQTLAENRRRMLRRNPWMRELEIW